MKRILNPRCLWSNRKVRICIIVVAVVISVAVGCCAFLRISRPADIEAYFGMAIECDPVWRQFALRQFSAGDSAAELLRRFPPDQREEFGRYGVYSYGGPLAFAGFSVVTREDRKSTRLNSSHSQISYAVFCLKKKKKKKIKTKQWCI